jgi:hypothetical protein
MPILQHKDILQPGKVFEGLQKELTELNTKVTVLTKSLKTLQDQTRNVNKTGSGAEAKQRVELTNKLSTATSGLTKVQKERQRVEKQLQTIFTRSLTANEKRNKLLVKGRIRLQEQNKALREAARAELGLAKTTKGLTTRLAGLGRQLVGALGVTAGVSALVGVVKNAVKIFKTFDKSASRLAAILGETKNDIKELTDQAKQLGATTAFTASEVIGLQTELAKLGFSMREIEDSTPGILALAAATGSELAPAAELAGSTLRIFNLGASEMSRVTDVLAKSTTISSLSMEKLATILPTVGKTAQIAGVSLERTAALAGTLTDRGLDASTAATSLRNIFLELSKKGLTWEQAMRKINSSTDKNKTAMDLFGKRAASAGVILAETADSTDKLTTSLVNSTGAAQEMADVMLDNLSGDITIAQSAWEGFVLSLEDGNGAISGVLRDLTQGFTDFLGGLTDFNDESKSTIEQLDGLKTSLEKIIRVSSVFGLLWNKIKDAFIALNPGLEESLEHFKALFGIGTKATTTLKKIEQNLVEALESEADAAEEAANAAKLLEEAENSLSAGKSKSIELTKKQIKEEQRLALERFNAAQKLRQAGLEAAEADELAQRIADRELDELLEREHQENLGQIKLDAAVDTNEGLAQINREARERELAEEQALQDLAQQAEQAGIQIASDIFAASQDKKVQEAQDRAKAEEAILKDQLDKGLINEIQFERKLAESRKKARIVEAQAEKRKALFDIGIQTAVAIVKALPNLFLVGIAAATGAIQAAVVASKPVKFAKGTEYVEGPGTGTSDSIPAQLSKGERVVPAHLNKKLNGISNTDLINAISEGHVKDNDTALGNIGYTSYDLIGLQQGIDKLNSSNEKLVSLGMNTWSMYEDAGYKYFIPANGGDIIKVNKNESKVTKGKK